VGQTLLTAGTVTADQATLRLLGYIIDSVIDTLELWQLADGAMSSSWVSALWSRRIGPAIGIDLPPRLRAAADAATLHRELLAWQREIIDALR
jgi:hypothetical protein